MQSRETRSDKAEKPSAYEKAVMMLARREHSRHELMFKLTRDDYSADEASSAIDELIAAGLQSDERFCEVFIRSRVARGQGPIKIEAELRERGIDSASIALELEAAAVDWRQLAGEALQKRFGTPPADMKERARQLRFLASRGFSGEHSYAAIDEFRE